MRFADCGKFDQTFTHVDKTTRAVLMINASQLNRHLLLTDSPAVRVPVTAEDALYIEKNHGVEPARLAKITDPDLRRPITFIEWGDGTHLLVDGNHRYVQAYSIGKRTMLAWLVAQEVWRQFVIEDVPPSLAAIAVADVFEGQNDGNQDNH
jgi:hypothetical protein